MTLNDWENFHKTHFIKLLSSRPDWHCEIVFRGRLVYFKTFQRDIHSTKASLETKLQIELTYQLYYYFRHNNIKIYVLNSKLDLFIIKFGLAFLAVLLGRQDHFQPTVVLCMGNWNILFSKSECYLGVKRRLAIELCALNLLRLEK